VADFLRDEFSRHLGGKLLILNDVEIALDAAFQGRRGVLLLAGTGSNLAARASNGAIFTVGGWGPNLGDQGSGHWIGLEGLRRGFLARDAGHSSQLLDSARKLFQLPNDDALIEFANSQHPVRYASKFAPEVVSLAAQGDEVAIEILEQGGRDLAYLAGLVIERMKTIEPEVFMPPPVAITGGILTNVERLRHSARQTLRERYPTIEFLDMPADPVRGALWRAIRGC
jgi:N-acetylglucosamine kinase-like BadF-type ATPase